MSMVKLDFVLNSINQSIDNSLISSLNNDREAISNEKLEQIEHLLYLYQRVVKLLFC